MGIKMTSWRLRISSGISVVLDAVAAVALKWISKLWPKSGSAAAMYFNDDDSPHPKSSSSFADNLTN